MNSVPDVPQKIQALRDRFVHPFYLRLLHGNFTFERVDEAEATDFRHAVSTAASEISNEQITALLGELEWRGRLCAGWFIGLTRRAEFVPAISDLLLASEVVYSGQSYCLALAVIGTKECEEILCAYLDRYLPINGRVFNQDWAIGALASIRGEVPSKYLHRTMWQESDYSADPAVAIRDFHNVISHLHRRRMIEAAA